MLKVTVCVAAFDDETKESASGTISKDFKFHALPRVNEKIDLLGTGDYEPVKRVWHTCKGDDTFDIQIDVWVEKSIYSTMENDGDWK